MNYPRGPQQRAPGPSTNQVPRPGFQAPRPAGYRPQGPPPGPQDPARMRRMQVDKIIADCYSKVVLDKNGKRVTEASYQTHVNVREYSAFPTHPPPPNLPPSQVGTPKDRILTICTRYTGRTLIQKGKLNDSKNVYQIGRTWDMDELKAITRAGERGIILSLNKDYYWLIPESAERAVKFARHLAQAYGAFMGRYPVLNGYTLQDLKLPPIQKKPTGDAVAPHSEDIQLNEPRPNPQLLKTRSLKRKNLPNPVLPPQPQNADSPQANNLYTDLDFTANGNLPSKPMKVMLVDRPLANSSVTSVNDLASSDYRRLQLDRSQHTFYLDLSKENVAESSNLDQDHSAARSHKSDDSANDSHSFVFTPNTASTQKEPYLPERLQDYVRTSGGRNSPLRNYKHRADSTEQNARKVSENMESSAALGMQLEDKLLGKSSSSRSHRRQSLRGHQRQRLAVQPNDSPDFGIEEVEDDDIDEPALQLKRIEPEKNDDFIEESTKLGDDTTNAIDSSIQDIEDFMDSHLNFDGHHDLFNRTAEISRELNSSTLDETIEETSYSQEDNSTENHRPLELKLKSKIDSGLMGEKDAEVEEILDDINWSTSDNGDILIKKLSHELSALKYNNVKQLVTLDFGHNSISKDMTDSLNELSNLSTVFKRAELGFKFLSHEINSIENDSKGLQVKSINKKLLYNDLKGVLSKISINADDLRDIESFTQFDRLNLLEPLEEKLLDLHYALGAIRNDFEEDSKPTGLGTMKALTQYQSKYESVTTRFTKHFLKFMESQFDLLFEQLNSASDKFYPSAIYHELSNQLIYSSFVFFLKDVSISDFLDLNGIFTGKMSTILEKVLIGRVRTIKNSSTGVSHVSKVLEQTLTRRSRTLRLSARKERFLHKRSLAEGLPEFHVDTISNKNSSEVEDPRAVIELLNETKDLITVLQFFLASMFHYDNNVLDFQDFMKQFPFSQRRRALDNTTLDDAVTKTFTNDLIANLNGVFGGYLNVLLQKVNVADLTLPVILAYLETYILENEENHENIFCVDVFKKISEKYKGNWNKFVRTQVEIINKSTVVAGCGVLPSMKNAAQLLLVAESSLEQTSRGMNEPSATLTRSLLDDTSTQLTEAIIHLFMRDDPLLKKHEFDDKERELRNVSILQNLFYVTEQLSAFNLKRVNSMRSQLGGIFNKVQDVYFQKILSKSIGKLIEFVTNYESLSNMGDGKSKKYNKKYVKTLLSAYTNKDVTAKAQELHKKLEKHFVTGNDMLEKDLLDRLWKDMERKFVDYFTRLNNILRHDFDRDIDYNISKQDIHSMFASIY